MLSEFLQMDQLLMRSYVLTMKNKNCALRELQFETLNVCQSCVLTMFELASAKPTFRIS